MQKYAKWLSLTGTLFMHSKQKKMKFLLLYFILKVSAIYNTATKRETEVVQEFINNFDGELSEKVKILKGINGWGLYAIENIPKLETILKIERPELYTGTIFDATLNSHAVGMAVAQPFDFEIDVARNPICESAA